MAFLFWSPVRQVVPCFAFPGNVIRIGFVVLENMDGEYSSQDAHGRPYMRLAAMMVFSFVSMYVLMYAMVDAMPNVVHNLNQVYMAGLMAAPMLVIELLLMSMMYPSKKWNAVLIVLGIVALGGFWVMIRVQAAIGDRQFLRSMIPHHAGAILMCGEAKLQDPEIVELCRGIRESQLREIDQMKKILERLDK